MRTEATPRRLRSCFVVSALANACVVLSCIGGVWADAAHAADNDSSRRKHLPTATPVDPVYRVAKSPKPFVKNRTPVASSVASTKRAVVVASALNITQWRRAPNDQRLIEPVVQPQEVFRSVEGEAVFGIEDETQVVCLECANAVGKKMPRSNYFGVDPDCCEDEWGDFCDCDQKIFGKLCDKCNAFNKGVKWR